MAGFLIKNGMLLEIFLQEVKTVGIINMLLSIIVNEKLVKRNVSSSKTY